MELCGVSDQHECAIELERVKVAPPLAQYVSSYLRYAKTLPNKPVQIHAADNGLLEIVSFPSPPSVSKRL